jgi:hypothetical protein
MTFLTTWLDSLPTSPSVVRGLKHLVCTIQYRNARAYHARFTELLSGETGPFRVARLIVPASPFSVLSVVSTLVVKLNDDFQHDDHPFQMGAPLPPKTLSGRCQD